MLGHIAGDVLGPSVDLKRVLDPPLGQRIAHAAAPQDAFHDTAAEPVIRHARQRANQRVTIGVTRLRRRLPSPDADADVVEAGVSHEGHHQLKLDVVRVLPQQLDPTVSRHALHHLVQEAELEYAYQNTSRNPARRR